jgi:MoaA/NifB/PqqE/SkfB family radical SAM enzyme
MASREDTRDGNFGNVISRALKVFFIDALKISLRYPLRAFFFLRTVRWQQKAANLRERWEQQNIHVPPIMIFSITNKCNLNCAGCYHQALERTSMPEMSDGKLRDIITEADVLGISFMILAGGEPLVRPEMFEITRDFPQIIFLVFTNGLLIDDQFIDQIKKQKNVVPVISLEGWEEDTDARRGKGIFEMLQSAIDKLKKRGIFWSVSLTVTRSNFDSITDYNFIQSLTKLGCKLVFFLEYTPIEEGTEDWIIIDEQRAKLLSLRDYFRSKFSSLFIAVPGDEADVGGCLSAGRGFVHVSADGNIEPCPFAPYSDTNLREMTLKEALQSNFLKSIRNNHDHISETEGGCALWMEREWVKTLLHK